MSTFHFRPDSPCGSWRRKDVGQDTGDGCLTRDGWVGTSVELNGLGQNGWWGGSFREILRSGAAGMSWGD